ncbi:4-coumarate--CoA ligase-like 9 [Mercurialis annua]|uniref:4-coumarate--CoA ligase-like 9 n=1 Tax=Mercurialis annua TaxID=3986 RepID=UPI00215EAC97|nr:4-coumarate--CoA ligase-like 9 [Mercurialis annua]
MDQTNPGSIDPKTGFNSLTKTFHSLRPVIDLPQQHDPISVTDFALSNRVISTNSVALIDSSTTHHISYSEFAQLTKSLSSYFQNVTKLSQHDVAFVLCPKSTKIPILYFSLLSLGIIISPSNPLNTESEIHRQIHLSKPVIAFATSATAHKLPKLKHSTILIDSPEFDSLMTTTSYEFERVTVRQSDLAGILYSSGTTGDVKAVMLTHGNLTAVVAGFLPEKDSEQVVTLNAVPYFHVYGLIYSLKSVALREAVVVVEKFDLKSMLSAVQEFRVTQLAVAPPAVVEMIKRGLTDGYDLRSLEDVVSGGAPLGKDVIAAFRTRFPTVSLKQGYGMTESTGVCSRAISPEESFCMSSVGRVTTYCIVKIVDPETNVPLLPGEQGELWISGPMIMKGYVGDPKATFVVLTSDRWLRTGDLCYIDKEGYVFVVDRLKDLIKYKGYQVAPAELEQLLQSHPEIIDAAVVPYPDEEVGEVPFAFVVKHCHSSLNERNIMDYVSKQVAPYKKVRRVAFISSIPKSPSGKILRKDLRKMNFSTSKSRM